MYTSYDKMYIAMHRYVGTSSWYDGTCLCTPYVIGMRVPESRYPIRCPLIKQTPDDRHGFMPEFMSDLCSTCIQYVPRYGNDGTEWYLGTRQA